MTTTLAKLNREYGANESATAAACAAGRMAHSQDTGRLFIRRRDGVTGDWSETASRLAGQTTVLGLALIGMSGITGITPNGGSSGAAATAANMLIGMRDSMILKSPYNSTINTIQPTADYVPLNIKGFASGVSNLLTLQTSSTTVAWFDNSANLTLSRGDAGNDVSIRILNSDNTNPASNAKILLSTGGASAGDPFINYSINGVQQWSEGIDRSDGYKYKISEAATLGTNDALIIAPSGTITLNRAVAALSTLDVTGLQSNSEAIVFVANGTAGAGRIFKSAANGLEIQGSSGISGSFMLKDSSGNAAMSLTGGNICNFLGGSISVSGSNAGGNNQSSFLNLDNTNSASHASIQIRVQGSSGGDPYTLYTINGVTNWVSGIDNSVSGDPFKISFGNALGTNDALTIDSSLLVTLPGTLTVTGLITASSGVSVPDTFGLVTTISATSRAMAIRSGTTLNIGENGGWTAINYRLPTGGSHVFQVNATTVGTFDVNGLALPGRLTFTGNGTTAAGSILKTAADGLLLRGITGSSNDFGLYSAAGTLVLSNPTGTVDLSAGGNLTLSHSNTNGTVLILNNGSAGGKNWSIASGGSAGGAFPTGNLTFRNSSTGANALTIDSSLNALFGSSSVTSGQANLGVAGTIGFGASIGGTAFTSLAIGTGATLYKVPYQYWTGSAWETRYLASIAS